MPTPDPRDDQLAEVLADAADDYWPHLPQINSMAHRFFFSYARSLLTDDLEPDETKEARFSTALMLVFLAGREHHERGYPSPVQKGTGMDEIDDNIAELIERMSEAERDERG